MNLAGFEKGFHEMHEAEVKYIIDAIEAKSLPVGA